MSGLTRPLPSSARNARYESQVLQSAPQKRISGLGEEVFSGVLSLLPIVLGVEESAPVGPAWFGLVRQAVRAT